MFYYVINTVLFYYYFFYIFDNTMNPSNEITAENAPLWEGRGAGGGMVGSKSKFITNLAYYGRSQQVS